jgi:hypothetical protein
VASTTTESTRSSIVDRSISWGGIGIAAALLSGCSVGVSGTNDPQPSTRGPTQGTYDTCTIDAECTTDECWEITVDYDDRSVTDAMCTYGCSSDLDCDFGGLCVAISSEPPLCYQPCFDDSDCVLGFACIADEFDENPLCLPW